MSTHAPPLSVRPVARPTGGRGRPATLPLALAESRRLLCSLPVLCGAIASAVLLLRADGGWLPALHLAAIGTQRSLLPLAAGTLVAANLTALRSRRARTGELETSTCTPAWRRTLAYLLALAAPALLGGVLAVLKLLLLVRGGRAAGTPDAFELLTGPAVIWLAGTLGVLAARWLPSVVTAPVLVVLAAVVQLGLPTKGVQSYGLALRWLVPAVPLEVSPTVEPELPAFLLGRPSGAHLAFLAAAALAVGAAAVAGAGTGARTRLRAGLAGAVALALVACAAQLQPPSRAEADRLVAAFQHPERFQACHRRGPVAYCAFPGYEPWIDVWAATVEGPLEHLPREVARPRLTVRQMFDDAALDRRLARSLGLPDSGNPGPVHLLGVVAAQDPAPDVVPVDMTWPTGPAERDARLALASRVAARAVMRPSPRGEEPPPRCQAPAVVALWLAASSTHGGKEALRQALVTNVALDAGLAPTPELLRASPAELQRITQHRSAISFDPHSGYPVLSWFDPGHEDEGEWGLEEANLAVQLLERPDAAVRAQLARHWDELTAPGTTRQELAHRLGLPPVPSLEELFTRRGATRAQAAAAARAARRQGC